MKTVRAIAWVIGMLSAGAALAVDFAMPPASLPLPLKKHVQRFVDSTQTRNYQCCPVRTYRALAPFKYSSTSDSFYTVVGNSYFKYSAPQLLAGGQALSRISRVDVGGELFLGPDARYDKDDVSSGWPGVQDGQFFLNDFDFDDRGIHYIAYSVFGWGLINESFQLQWRLSAASTGQTCTATNCPDNSMIVAVRDGANYYALVGGPGVWGVWNVNNPAAPVFVRVVNFNGYLTRDSSGTTLAATDISSTVRIIEASQFVAGNPAGKSIGLSSSTIAAAYDGSSFWFLPFSGGSTFTKVSPPLWNATAYPVTGTTVPFFSAQAGADYVIGMDGPTTTRLRVYAIRPTGVEEVTPITDYMASYYQASDLQHRSLTPFSYNGKTYFLWSMYNVGDVYEVLAGDSLSVTRDTTASPGTVNPNAPPNSSATPFYGDRQTFKATFAGTTPPSQIKWSPDYPGVAFGAGTAVSTPFTHTYTGTAAATKKIRAEDVSRPDVFGETTITLQLPTARVKIPGITTPVAASQSVGKLLTGGSFYDASDGVVEGHVTDWSLDNGTNAVSQDPRNPFSVGPCGSRTLTFTARYGTYAPSRSLTYTVQPMISKIAIDEAASVGSNVVFLNQSTYGTGFQVNPVWVETWELVDGSGGVVRAQVSSPTPLGTVTTFTVAKSEIQAGYKVRLRMSIDVSITPTGCEASSQLSDEATVLLTPPDPDIVTTSCTAPTTLAGSCTLSVRSISSASQSGWAYAWYLDSSSTPSSTAATYSPSFATIGAHTVTVVATNPFGNAQDTQSLNVTTPPCNGAPPQGLISWTSTQTGTRTFDFDARAFSYTFQACDQFSWNFGDGGTANGKSVTHTFAADNTYTVTLVVSNTNGSATFSNTQTVGVVAPPPPPPPPCASPANKVYIGWTAASGCAPGLGMPPCKTGESVQFTVDTLPGFSLASCHTYNWQFGDGTSSTSRNPVKAYATAGTFNVSLTVSNGSVPATTSGTVKVETATCGTSVPSSLDISYFGLTSNCSTASSVPCKEGESFRFGIVSNGSFQLQGCETVSWDFGDGTTSSAKEPTHTFPGIGPYDVLASVANTQGSVVLGKTIRFFDPSIPKPVVSISPVSTKAKVGSEIHFVGSFQSGAELVAINWRVIRTTFGDEVVHTATNTGDISYTFNEIGDYKIELTATNAGGVSTPATALVAVAEVQEYSFLIPVVAHLPGNNGTQWRTDLQIFNTDPLNGPIEFEFEFRGGAAGITKTIVMTSSTQIYEDFLGELSKPFPSLEDAGPVIVRARGDSPPQMWTRTYTVDASDVGTYGQLIPAISLDSALPSEEQVTKYVLPGLEISSRFRTNVGIVNLSTQTVTVNVMARDDSALGIPIGNFDIQVPPFGLNQIGDLGVRIPGIGQKAFSLNIQPLGNFPVVVYGSMIDMNSNDPVFVSGIRDTDQESSDKRVQIVPGTGHLEQGNGTWRSDIVIYNPDVLPLRFDLSYYDTSGTRIAEAKNQVLGNGAFKKVEDVLKWDAFDVDPGNSFGILKVETDDSASPIGRYPIIFQRTYKDRDELGSFGQGIPAISSADANVTADRPAFIAGVRSDESYYTNLGLVALGDEPSVVRVTLLHDGSGTPVGTWQYVVDGQVIGINPNASLIVTNIIRAISPLATKGTLKIEVLSGGDIWAYASVIAAADPTNEGWKRPEHTFDPEYIPAVRMPTP